MTYVPDATLATMLTLDRTKVQADDTSLVTNTSALAAGSVRNGTRFSWSKLEFPHAVTVVSDGFGHQHWDWRMTGRGKPIVFDDQPSPIYNWNGDAGAYDTWIGVESQNFVNVLPPLPVPAWTHADAATPKMRLLRLCLAVQLITNDEGTEDAAAPGKAVFAGDADIAQQLVVRAHRVQWSALRQQFNAIDTDNPNRYLDHVSEKVDAWKLGQLTGMAARARNRNAAGNVPAAALHPDAAGGAPGTKRYATFAATALLGPDVLAMRQNLAPGDAVIVSITGPDRLIYAGDAAYDRSSPKRNIILPVMGAHLAAVFATEPAR